jgi:hypothetical protein
VYTDRIYVKEGAMAEIVMNDLQTLTVDIAMIRVGAKTMSRAVFNQIPSLCPDWGSIIGKDEDGHQCWLAVIDNDLWEKVLGFVLTSDMRTRSEISDAIWVYNGMLRKFRIIMDKERNKVSCISHTQLYVPRRLKQLFLSA